MNSTAPDQLVSVEGANLFVRIRQSAGPAIVLIHGLGESSLCFEEAFTHPSLVDCCLLACDLPGFGRSSPDAENRYDFDRKAAQVLELTRKLLENRKVVLVGHSMGGDLVTYLASRWPAGLCGIVNLDGNVVDEDLSISGPACGATDFAAWFQSFKEEQYRQGSGSPPVARYFASLCFARAKAFLRSAQEMDRIQSEQGWGNVFAGVPLPHLFVARLRSPSEGALNFLAERAQDLRFVDAGHWLMIDAPEKTYRIIGDRARAWCQ